MNARRTGTNKKQQTRITERGTIRLVVNRAESKLFICRLARATVETMLSLHDFRFTWDHHLKELADPFLLYWRAYAAGMRQFEAHRTLQVIPDDVPLFLKLFTETWVSEYRSQVETLCEACGKPYALLEKEGDVA